MDRSLLDPPSSYAATNARKPVLSFGNSALKAPKSVAIDRIMPIAMIRVAVIVSARSNMSSSPMALA